jgi:hypothetical protein
VFIRIGSRVVNMRRVSHVDLGDTGDVTLFIDGGDGLRFGGDEAVKLLALLDGGSVIDPKAPEYRGPTLGVLDLAIASVFPASA